MSLAREVEALRTSVAFTRAGHVRALRVSGPGAFELLDAATSSRLFMREGQLLQTLMLCEDGTIFADVYVGQDEESLILLSEGPSTPALLAHLEQVRTTRAPTADAKVEALDETHALFSVDGPFAWELASAVLSPQVLGAPYLSFLHVGDVTCFRIGKTGEYGYLCCVPLAGAESLWSKLTQAGELMGAHEGSLAALDQCALENWHFTMRALGEGGPRRSPLELQLQWRVDLDKAFHGAEAYRRRRQAGVKERLTCFVAKERVEAGSAVRHGEREIGRVLAATWSETRQDCVGWALLEIALAHPGISSFTVTGSAGPQRIETRAPPLLDNRSLFVDPHRHTFRTRGEHVFPPLVSG